MFKRIAILTALATTASSAAYAGPWPFGRVDADIYIETDRDRDRYDRRYDRYDRYDRRFDREHAVALGSHLSGYQEVWLNGQHHDIRRIVIQGERGAPYIRQVTVDYEHGGPTAVRFDQRLRRGESRVIRVDHRPIKRIVINTAQTNRGSYSIFGI